MKEDKMKAAKKILTLLLIGSALFLSIGRGLARERIAEGVFLDKTIHDFGDILLDEGPVSCTFTLVNESPSPVVIYSVVSSCGCTDVKWTREPVKTGGEGKITATYTNDEGPYPFDKTLTMYVSGIKKPIVLRLRGTSMEKKKSLEERYPIRFGSLGMKEDRIKCGNLEQGGVKSGCANVANLSDKPLKVDFSSVSDFLDISISPNPIPGRSEAQMEFKVTSSWDKWGKNWYWATPSTGDGGKIGIWAFTKEDFSALSDEQKASGPRPTFSESTFSCGKMKRGGTIHAEFEMKNDGKSCLQIFKVDADTPNWSHSTIPGTKPGQKTKFRVHVDTSALPKGEILVMVTLTTNSPLRPIVNLFIAGYLE